MNRFVLALVLLTACSDGTSGGKSPPDECVDCKLDAGSRMDASKGSPPPQRPLQLDAATTEELRAKVQVNGANTICGTCSVVLAQAQGGVFPYTYEWSDPSLIGPGPHRVCPDQPTKYSVIVRDSASMQTGEFARESDSVEAVGETNCVVGDAGSGFAGCWTQVTTDAGADAGVTCGDAGVAFDFTTGAQGTVTVSTQLADGFKAGQTYEYSHDRLIPITLSLGQAVSVDVYGANDECGLDEKLFTLTYDLFTWHQAFCFTPTQDYRYLITAIHLNGAIFSWEALIAGTTCAGCSQKP